MRNAIVGLVVVAVIAIIAVFIIGGDKDAESRQPVSATELAGQEHDRPSPPPSSAPEREARARDVQVPAAPTPSAERPTSGIRGAAAEHRRRARYPDDSDQIIDGRDPILEQSIRHPRQDPVAGGTLKLVSYLEPQQVAPGEPAVVFATLLRDGEPVPAPQDGLTVAMIAGAGRRAVGEPAFHLAADEGWTYRAELDTSSFPADTQEVDVYVKLGKDVAAHTLVIGAVGAEPTGRYRDRLIGDTAGSNLAIDVELTVRGAGTYLVRASIYAGETALGWTEGLVAAGVGTTWATLELYGAVICDAGADGPYTVRYLVVEDANRGATLRGATLEDVHVTSPYPANTFTCEGFDDPDQIEKARYFERLAEGR